MPDCCKAKSCQKVSATSAQMRVALVGNPNGGKTTLFNALTGSSQSVGNWPGVTVERVSGFFTESGVNVEVVDLPGTYSLTAASDVTSIDECIACEFIGNNEADVIINIVDASHLERHLYLTMQLLEMGLPVVLALNMIDVAHAKKIHIDAAKLSAGLGCPVVSLSANRGVGLADLKRAILQHRAVDQSSLQLPYPIAVTNAVTALMKSNIELNASTALHLLEDDMHAQKAASQALLEQVLALQQQIRQTHQEDADILIAETRYQFIQSLLEQSLTHGESSAVNWTARIDRVVLNRWLGIPVFLSVMYLLFVFAIDVGGFFQEYFDAGSSRLFVDGLASLLTNIGSPTWLTVLLANGVGKGISTVVTFVPVIGAMFLFLAFLEDSGYMSRAAFVVDRMMRALGLPGKAFVPMIVGFGCNVPAVMAARTLEHQRDRILTILMTPFMSCGARLAIYAVFAAAFFPHGGQNIVFALYLIGVMMAIFTGFLLQRTLLRGQPAPLVMELPSYHLPHIKSVLMHAWQRLQGFVFRAGKLIVPICILIGALNSFNIDGTMNAGDGDTHSLLSIVGQWMTPIFSPMGIHADNWPATVGLVTGVLAKEVVVGTLNTLYTQMGHVSNAAGVYGVMFQKFDGQIGAFAYLLFVLLYFPCVSTMAVMLREMHRGWTLFSAAWMIGAAYGVAVVFYQTATYARHPLSSALWVSAMLSVFVLTIIALRLIARRDEFSRLKKQGALTTLEGAA